MSETFNRKTFEYLEAAEKNKMNMKWFEKNKDVLEENVKAPFSYLVKKLDFVLGSQFPGIPILPRKISLANNKCSAYFAEKSQSMFEWNPGLYLTINSEENIMGHGLYRPSSRQMKILRAEIMRNPAAFSRLVKNPKFRATWGELAGERFTRFPRDYNPDDKGAEFLWHKQFNFQKTLTRKMILDRNFSDIVIQDFRLTAPYINWMRETVGVYEREKAG